MIAYEEEDAVKRILRHHEATVTPKLVGDLSALLEWVRQDEAAKYKLNSGAYTPPLMISLLSNMGIYGKDYLNKVVS